MIIQLSTPLETYYLKSNCFNHVEYELTRRTLVKISRQLPNQRNVVYHGRVSDIIKSSMGFI